MRTLITLHACLGTLLRTAAAAPTSSSLAGNFSLSCTAIDLWHNFFLGATCRRPGSRDGTVAAQSNYNQLDLTMCIGLDQATGHMQWEVYGKFSNYCTNCTVHASRMLTCACTPLIHGEKGPIKSTLNLDDGITNDMGTLKCAGGMAAQGRQGQGEGGGCP